jgi:hypothetical protein
MANVLNEEKKQQSLSFWDGWGWSLRRIQHATHIRRATASTYLKAARIAVRPPSGWGRHEPKSAILLPDPLDPTSAPSAISSPKTLLRREKQKQLQNRPTN